MSEAKERIFHFHDGGKIETKSKIPLQTQTDLAIAYTPGVAQVCQEIASHPEKVYELTIKKNTVLIVTDGTALLGLGDLGPDAALPVMEGKALLLKELAGVDAFPICLNEKDPDKIVEIIAAIQSSFGAINLEDISAPRCFDIERKLQERLDIPVFHDDQHGTAVVCLAAVLNSLKVTGKSLSDIKIVFAGAGAAGIATSRMLIEAGARNLILCDRMGAIYEGRPDMNSTKAEMARISNLNKEAGSLKEVIRGADLFIGLSGSGILDLSDIQSMNKDPIVFAMSNPEPEIDPELIANHAAVIATGRSDYPNQINNVLCFPGMFKGLLAARANKVTSQMKIMAAQALADMIDEHELRSDYIIPNALDKKAAEAVANAVIQAASSAQ